MTTDQVKGKTMFSVSYYILLPEQLPEFLATLAVSEKVINCELEEGKLRIQTEIIE